MDLTYDKLAQLQKLSDNYCAVEPFARKYPRLTYMQLDYAVMHELSLFTLEPNFSFEALDDRLDEILSALPAIKRIFAQPCIHLKERDEIMPTEAVRIVNNNTIKHISSHSELWTDVTDEEIKPRKLITRIYEDNYGIYENLVFCDVIDDIMAFVRANLRFIQELIYANQTIEINLLERLNHTNYFLALGKLHTGYSRNFDTYYAISVRCLNKLQFISNAIVPRLGRPVYKNNKLRAQKTKLRKTNILSMHKEYHQVYRLAKLFASGGAEKKLPENVDADKLQKNYFYFCELLCVFAAGNFNFECDANKKWNFADLTAEFACKSWLLKIKKAKLAKCCALILEVRKEKRYKVALVPSIYEENAELLQRVQDELSADEYVVCTPYEDAEERHATIDINNVESFRRLQQILLRAMIFADTARDECPFCSNKLTLDEERSTADSPLYRCESCRTEIGAGYCPETDKTFPYTRIANFKRPALAADDDWLAKRKQEAQMYFRNITDLNEDAEIVCPHCGKAH